MMTEELEEKIEECLPEKMREAGCGKAGSNNGGISGGEKQSAGLSKGNADRKALSMWIV